MSSTILRPIIQYSRFILDEANRDIKPNRVENLAEGIDSMNCLDLYPLVVTGEWKIMDGQTRYMASRGMQKPCYAIVSNDVSIEDMAEANSNTEKYSQEDSLHIYTKMGFCAYEYVRKFREENKHLNLSVARDLLSGAANGREFSDGQFSVDRPKYAQVASGYIRDFKNVFPWITAGRGYGPALANLAHNSEYNHERMMDRLGKVAARVLPCSTAEEAYGILFDLDTGIYNFGIPERNRIKLAPVSRAAARASIQDKGWDAIGNDQDPPTRTIAPAHEVTIHCTDDLSQFSIHPSARPLNEGKLQKLIEFMRRRNLLHCYPIIVDRNLVVYDGQKRLAAARELGLPIFYIVASNISIWMTALAGGRSSRWGDQDYLKHFCTLGYDQYISLRSFREKYSFIILSAAIKFLDGRDKVRALYHSGGFRMNRLETIEKMASQLKRIENEQLRKNHTFQEAVLVKMSKPDFFVTLFVDRLNKYPVSFGIFGDAESCAKRIDEVYNHRPSDIRSSQKTVRIAA